MSTTHAKKTVVHRPANDSFEGALDPYRARMAALEPAQLVRIRIDIPSAVTTVLGALPKIALLRATAVEMLPQFDIATLDDLRGMTLALGQAQSSYLSAAEPDGLSELTGQATKLRNVLAADAAALAARGLLSANRVDEVKGGPGYRHLAFELWALSTLLTENVASTEGKTALTTGELEKARDVSKAVLEAVADHGRHSAARTQAADDRRRIFTLFYNAYAEIREAIAYIRHKQGDVDDFAPTLFAGRGRPKKASRPAAPVVTTPTTAPSSQTGGTTAPTSTTGGTTPPQAPPSTPTSTTEAGPSPVTMGTASRAVAASRS